MKSKLLVLTYCPYYDEVAKLALEDDDELCEKKKRQIKRNDDDSDDDDDSSSDSDEKKKRRGLGRRQLKKRLALRFLHKRLA